MSATAKTASAVDLADEVSLYEESPNQAMVDRRELDILRERAAVEVQHVSGWLQDVVDRGSGSGESGSQGSEGDIGATTAVAYAVTGLSELAKRVQRICRNRLLRQYKKGRGVHGADRRGPPRRMKQFSLAGSRTLLELETADGIYDELCAEKRVVTQVTARTAIGKTTIFPSRLATRCNRRVLLVEPDVSLARYAAERQSGVVKVRTPWCKVRTSVLTTMSYDDFNGQFRGQNGIDMVNQFDVIMFDEAHMVDARTTAAKTLVATYSETASLLVCSATIDGQDTQVTGRPVDLKHTTTSLREMVDKGHLFKPQVGKDRTLVIATDDQEAHYIGDAVLAEGFDVRVLDSASRSEEILRANDFLKESGAIANRFLIVTPEYGVGANFCTGNLVTSGQKIQHVMNADGTRLERLVVPCSQAEIKQQVGRVNRGMTDSASALVCQAPDNIVEVTQLTESERLRYYVTMVAAHTMPTKALTDSVSKLLPFGLTQRVALDLLAINLPIEVAIRFFAKDGRIPYKYSAALSAFSEAEHQFMTSSHDEPLGRDLWVSEPMSGYYDEVQPSMPAVEVPCHSEGEVKVILHAICASALGLMQIEDWMPSVYDSDVSEDESIPQKRVQGSYLPRLIMDTERIRYRPVPAIQSYAYNVPQDEQFAPRSRLALHQQSISDTTLRNLATLDTDTSLQRFNVGCDVSEYQERGVERVGIVHQRKESTPVDVHSPGGSVVMAFRKIVWQKMVNGEALSPIESKSFFHSIKSNVEGFVESDAFSGWTDVWKSIFLTASGSENIQVIKNNNYTARVVSLILALVIRYSTAVSAVSKQSMIKASILQSMVRSKVSFDECYRKQSDRGRVEIAQSESFLRRLFEIRDVMVNCLTDMEDGGIFQPTVVTQLQQMLPVMRRTGIELFDKPNISRRFLKRLT